VLVPAGGCIVYLGPAFQLGLDRGREFLGFGANTLDHLGRHALVLRQQRKENVFGVDFLMLELAQQFLRGSQCFLCSLGKLVYSHGFTP
jgi:hypothetical protein